MLSRSLCNEGTIEQIDAHIVVCASYKFTTELWPMFWHQQTVKFFQNLIEKLWWCGEGDIHGNKEYSIASCIKYDLLEVISHCNSYRLFAGFDSSYSWKIVNSSNKNNFSTSFYQHYNCIFWTNEGLVLTYLQHNLWLQRQQNQQLEH